LLDKLGWYALRGCRRGWCCCSCCCPILVIMPLSFSDSSFLSYPMPGWSLKWYDNLFSSDEWARATRNSFIVAPLATHSGHRAGHAGRGGAGKAHPLFRQGHALMSLLIAPMVVPIVVVGVSTYLFFAKLGLNDTYLGLVLVHAALGAPFVADHSAGHACKASTRTSSCVSLSLGAGHLETFFRITLPVIAPGVISGALFAFATSFDEVVVTLFLAGPSR
jgi:putative spermidine/putrescine transport system permease protein